MKVPLTLLVATLTTATITVNNVVDGECLDAASGSSILDGAWNVMGVNGTWATADPPRLDDHNIGIPDPTWTIPTDGWSYAQGEVGDYGANYASQYTCTKLQFCNPETGSDSSTDDDEKEEVVDDDDDDEDAVWGCYRGGKCGEGTHGCCDCDLDSEEACAATGKDYDPELKPIWTDGCGSICTRRRLEKKYRAANRHLMYLDQDSEQPIYKMASKEAFNNCDFTDATLIGTTGTDQCVEVAVDDLALEGDKAYYASTEEACQAGQKLAVSVTDYESTASQCADIALHVPGSSRIRSCDCGFTKTPFSARYAALCALAYQDACYSVSMPDDAECCDTDTCYSKMELFENEMGREHELNRREECGDDTIPGNCYNADGTASDLSQDGSTDCCSQTCSSCGSELATGAVWEPCTSNDPTTMTATCGRLSRYAQEDFICDFSKCSTGSHWGTGNTPIYLYMGIGPEAIDVVRPETNGGESATDADAASSETSTSTNGNGDNDTTDTADDVEDSGGASISTTGSTVIAVFATSVVVFAIINAMA